MRNLSPIELKRIKVLTENSIPFTLIEPTSTALKKSIMDATASVRNYLKEQSLHDYTLQKQGSSHKIMLNALLVLADSTIKSQASLYRPQTKKGDPRIWFRKLSKHASANDILALMGFEGTIYVLNLTQLPLEKLLTSKLANPVQEIITNISNQENAIANELLQKLRAIAQKGFIPAQVQADTAVGRTLERVLGIDMNASKHPDYKGIELKSFRDRRKNRKNLFAQVPDWSLSQFKSSADILNHFGYHREGIFRLYCTVSVSKPNSQGLSLKLEAEQGLLLELSKDMKIGSFAVWLLEKLHQRLLSKHKETFWIAAESKIENNREYFRYYQVEHTQQPIVSQFDLLLEQGIITLDHLIKQLPNGSVKEKGPIFKLKNNSLDLLFPPSKIYDLLNPSI